jgi:hypothetical protein
MDLYKLIKTSFYGKPVTIELLKELNESGIGVTINVSPLYKN